MTNVAKVVVVDATLTSNRYSILSVVVPLMVAMVEPIVSKSCLPLSPEELDRVVEESL
jgi:hypothetical protein